MATLIEIVITYFFISHLSSVLALESSELTTATASCMDCRTTDLNLSQKKNSYTLNPNAATSITLRTNEEVTFGVSKKPRSRWRYLIFQAHTQYQNVSISTSVEFSYDSTYNGSGAATLELLPISPGWISFYLKSLTKDEDVSASAIAVPYNIGSPIAGGCCLTCNMENDPNIVLQYNSVETTLTFAFANIDYERQKKPAYCDDSEHPKHFRLKYTIYQLFMKESDFSDDELFRSSGKMAYPAVIKNYGIKVATVTPPDLPRVSFDTIRGQGVVYNIIVYDPTTDKEAAYSPAVTYGCSFIAKVDSCQSLGATVNEAFSIIGAIVGFVMCFLGHRLFKFTLFLGGTVNFAFIFFIILTNATDLDHLSRVLMSFFIGAFFGLVIFGIWFFTEYTTLCLLFNSLFLGFLIGATLFFTPLGDYDLWKSNFDYAVVLLATTLIIPFPMLLWKKLLSIVYTSVVSAFGFIIGIDFFLRTTMQYIVLDVILRATAKNFGSVHIRRPFQTNDYILSGTWILLSILGIAIQFYISKTRLDFPKSPYCENKRVRKYYTRPSEGTADERIPILINQAGYRNNDIC